MIEETDIPNVGTIDLANGTRIYVNTDESKYEKVEGMSYEIIMLDESEHPVIKGRIWICKKCELDNNGVICSECKRMFNPADPMCDFKD